uniref:Uncharacterized protein n=1 Tax=Rhizophora mucronata TaxID=61149 RepID=A0A2P2J1R5_RHIMU
MHAMVDKRDIPFFSVNIPDKTSSRSYKVSLSETSSLNRVKPSGNTGINCR